MVGPDSLSLWAAASVYVFRHHSCGWFVLGSIQPARMGRDGAAHMADGVVHDADAGDVALPHAAFGARRRDVERLSRTNQHHGVQHRLPVAWRHDRLGGVVPLFLRQQR